jgi:hypothetical protein
MSGMLEWATSTNPDPDPDPITPVVQESAGPESKVVSLRELLESHELVEVTDEGVIMLTDPSEKPSMRELGTASASPFTSYLRSEYNSELRGQNGLRKYDEMRKSDGTVRGTLREVKTPVLSGRWFVEAASEKDRDQRAADFVWWNLQKRLSMPWGQIVQECLLMLEFGYYMFEKVWIEDKWYNGTNTRDVLCWEKLAPRHPTDVVDWYFTKNGGPKYCEFEPGPDDPWGEPVPIKIEKLLVMSFDKEAGNIQGISLLRSAFKHWYYKEMLYKIDAIQKERHGIGVPVIKLPPNFTDADRTLAQAMGRNLRTNETAHLVLPPNWEVYFAKLEGQPVNALESAKHHDLQIQKNIMAPFLDKAVGADEKQTFQAACRFIAEIIADTFNKYAIPQLIGYNFERVGVPRLRATGIGSKTDLRTLSFALRNFVGAKLIEPDDRLETYLRDVADLPPKDPNTVRRELLTPQAPGTQRTAAVPAVPRAGLPRQSQAARMQQAQTAGNNGRVGRDDSGAS